MNKTIYIRDEDTAVWDRAKELAGEKLAPVIVEGLKRFIAESERKEAEAAGFERILLSYQDAKDSLLPKKKAFNGKWIIHPDKPYKMYNEDQTEAHHYALALTSKGSAAIFHWKRDSEEHFFGRTLDVYASLNEAAGDHEVRWAVIEAVGRIGVPVEELDI